MKKNVLFPEVIQKTESEIQAMMEQIKQSNLSEDLKSFVIKCIEIAIWVPMALESKNISIHRLKTIIFGKGYQGSSKKNTKKSRDHLKKNLPPAHSNPDPGTLETSVDSMETKCPSNVVALNPKGGHGRMPHTVYENCQEKVLKLVDLVVGSLCPHACGGRLYRYEPGIFIRIKGQNFAEVIRYTIEKLRCNLCGQVFAPERPPEVGNQKYDASFKAILALLKYYVAVPFYRQEYFQKLLGFPLPDATQWDLIEQLAGFCYSVFGVLKRSAANGNLMYNDDTKSLIIEVLHMIKAGTAGKRTGMYTTGIVAEYEGHQIALFFNGRQHSGENVGDVLQLRDPDKDPILQMCDALSANIPKHLKSILCNCLAHGFRKFVELVKYYEAACMPIIQKLGQVYEYDEHTESMSNEERLAYHQKYSKPVMDECYAYMDRLLTERQVEPHSELGKAIQYMKRHWDKLTRFLTVPGAPLDNNTAERALKIAIRNRKSSMFYKTLYSAQIGGMLTSLIYTCHLANENPHHYLIALQNYPTAILKAPEQWLPWNYRKTMQAYELNDASPLERSPPLDVLAEA